MRKILPVLLFTISFAQFEAGQKAISGELSDFSRNVTTWTSGGDKIKYTDATIRFNSRVSYFVIDNLAISFGLGYEMNDQAWECNDDECTSEWHGEELPSETLDPFGYMIGGSYYWKNLYGHASFHDASSYIDNDSYLALGAGYMVELSTGIYFDMKAEYRCLFSDIPQIPENAPEEGTLIGDILAAPGTESINLNLYGSIGVTVLF